MSVCSATTVTVIFKQTREELEEWADQTCINLWLKLIYISGIRIGLCIYGFPVHWAPSPWQWWVSDHCKVPVPVTNFIQLCLVIRHREEGCFCPNYCTMEGTVTKVIMLCIIASKSFSDWIALDAGFKEGKLSHLNSCCHVLTVNTSIFNVLTVNTSIFKRCLDITKTVKYELWFYLYRISVGATQLLVINM